MSSGERSPASNAARSQSSTAAACSMVLVNCQMRSMLVSYENLAIHHEMATQARNLPARQPCRLAAIEGPPPAWRRGCDRQIQIYTLNRRTRQWVLMANRTRSSSAAYDPAVIEVAPNSQPPHFSKLSVLLAPFD
jgi:hypothetical protein